jgi:hypothetical protein
MKMYQVVHSKVISGGHTDRQTGDMKVGEKGMKQSVSVGIAGKVISY